MPCPYLFMSRDDGFGQQKRVLLLQGWHVAIVSFRDPTQKTGQEGIPRTIVSVQTLLKVDVQALSYKLL
jgi:hypothetical protein